MKMPLKTLLPTAALFILPALPAVAGTVFICEGEGEGGSILYSDAPCKSGRGQTLHFPDVYTTGEGLSELEQKQLEEIRANEAEQDKQTIKLSPAEEVPVDDSRASMASEQKPDKKACNEAENSLRAWGRIMSLGYLPEQEATMKAEYENRKSKMEAACGN